MIWSINESLKVMSTIEKAEKISITLPPDMLSSIKDNVQAGRYGSTSEVIREAMRLWQQKQEEHTARIEAIRARLEHSANSGTPIPMEDVFKQIEEKHKKLTEGADNERI